MQIGGMVHALEEIHRLLKPAGILIDIHPLAEPTTLSVHHAGASDLVGQLSIQQWIFESEQADQALADVVSRGLSRIERRDIFGALMHVDSVDELRAHFAEDLVQFARDGWWTEDAASQAESLAARAEHLMNAVGSGADLTRLERAHIMRLRPI